MTKQPDKFLLFINTVNSLLFYCLSELQYKNCNITLVFNTNTIDLTKLVPFLGYILQLNYIYTIEIYCKNKELFKLQSEIREKYGLDLNRLKVYFFMFIDNLYINDRGELIRLQEFESIFVLNDKKIETYKPLVFIPELKITC